MLRMRRLSLAVLLVLPTLAHAAAPVRPAKLGQCVACHGDNGRSRIPGTPHLAGQDERYLAQALTAYRNGDRRALPMNSIANTLQPRDIAALARWYATQAAGGPR